MAAKLRKRPPRPADPGAPTPVEVVPPPPQAASAPIAQLAEPVLARNPDDVLHNIIVAQLARETKNPPPPDAENPALKALRGG